MKEKTKVINVSAIISHITLVGCLIAITINLEPKDKFVRYYIRQTFGLHVFFHAIVLFLNYTPIPFAWEVLLFIFFSLWLYSLFGVLTKTKKNIPILGAYFQKWFTFIQ